MRIRTKQKPLLARAAAVLVLALLTAQTAGAQDDVSGLTYNSAGGYYEINDAQDLVDLATYVNDGNNASGKTFKQTQDIDMSSISNFTPIGSKPQEYEPTAFRGTYDGQSNAIIDLTVNTESPYAGLFGYFEGTVRNVTMVNPNIKSSNNGPYAKYAGGIVGCLYYGIIENCNVINPTLNADNKGAISGTLTSANAKILNCYYHTKTNYNAGTGVGTISNTSRAYTLTLGDGITTSTAPAFSYGGTGYYTRGTTVTLGHSDRTGYSFNYAASGNVTVTDNQFTMPAADVTVTAVYTPITYSITYNAGEGNDFSTDKNTYTIESATITLDQPSAKTGYTFGGWYDNAGLTGDAITAIATGSTGNVELWAKWTANTYTIHFEDNLDRDYFGTMEDQVFTYDQAPTALTANTFYITTGEWLGWNTEADGSGTAYTDKQEVQNLTAEDGATVTLYAQWHLSYYLTYDHDIFHCYKVSNSNQYYWIYAGETVKVEVIDGSSEYTIYVTGQDGTDITLDTETNTFVMPDQEVYITSTSVKKMAYTTICLDDLDDWDVVYLYDANQPTVTPTVTVKDGETTLTEGTDYTLAITNNTGSATQMVTATVTVTGMGDYVGRNTKEFRITPFNIANCEMKGSLEAYDDGYGVYYPLSNNVEVWNGETKLMFETDYSLDVEYAESYEVGQSYNATVKGMGDWGGSKTFQFKVVELMHTVVFDANGGTGTMAGGTVGNSDLIYYLPVCMFTPPYGKAFDHWEVSCEEGEEKQPGQYFTAPYIRSIYDVQTITVTAYWKDAMTLLDNDSAQPEGSKNADIIANDYSGNANVTLSGRTLYKDGDWNTLCLPFSLTAEQIAASPLAGATLMALDGTTSNLTAGTLTLTFTTAESITAGTPYIIKWAAGDDIVDPVFSNVTIDKTMHDVATNDSKVTFKGSYDYQSFDAEDKDILFLGGGSTLYYPQDGASIGACRAYFQLNQTVGGQGEDTDVKAFVLNFGDETTAVTTPLAPGRGVGGEAWYDLNGRRFIGMPAQKGIYIINGKKVAVK